MVAIFDSSADSEIDEPDWTADGWRPLLRATTPLGDELRLTGYIGELPYEFMILDREKFDRDGPIFVRPRATAPCVFDITALHSDRFETRPRTFAAFKVDLAAVSSDVVARALQGDGEAEAELGRYVLYELGDAEGGLFYLGRALSKGVVDVILDLLGTLRLQRAGRTTQSLQIALPVLYTIGI